MTKRYVIDACSLIHANKNNNLNKAIYSEVWKKLSELFNMGILLSSSEIFDEIKDRDLQNWLKPYKKKFMPLTREIQSKTREILEYYPNLITIRSIKNSNGDPFLIATALVYNATVITEEGEVNIECKTCKIPNVCKHYNIECITFNEFIDRVT